MCSDVAPSLKDLRENVRLNFNKECRNSFRKGEKMRKRFKCEEVATKRLYLFSPLYEVVASHTPSP